MMERFPLITEAGVRLLRHLEEHPHAPRYTHRGLSRVTPAGLNRVREFAAEIHSAPPRWGPGEVPAWVAGFVAECFRAVPFYRGYGDRPRNFGDLPTCDRADLGREPWAFVPDGQSLDNLVVYNTSGTTGHPLDILTHADTLALYVPVLQAALATHGIALEAEAGRVAIAYVGFQKTTYTYVASLAALNHAGLVKLNLHPSEWRDPADRARFLDDCAPEIYTGTPLAFEQLAQLPLITRPKALVSTSMTLTPGLTTSLAAHFGCPVLDVYSMNESGPLGVLNPRRNTKEHDYVLLQPQLYVEILDGDGAPCLPGERGEITLTGGFNPFLPLLRYRTGDYAALVWRDRTPYLVNLEGRPPVVFRARDGRPINNIDVSLGLRHLPIAQFALHQAQDGALQMTVRESPLAPDSIRAALLALFGADQPLTIESVSVLERSEGKMIQYTSDIRL